MKKFSTFLLWSFFGATAMAFAQQGLDPTPPQGGIRPGGHPIQGFSGETPPPAQGAAGDQNKPQHDPMDGQGDCPPPPPPSKDGTPPPPPPPGCPLPPPPPPVAGK